MGTTSSQGVATLLFLAAFVFLAGALAVGGSPLLLLLFVMCAGASVAFFLKIKPLEHRKDATDVACRTGSAERRISAAEG